MHLRRSAHVALLTGAMLLVAAPALADPATPSNYVSTVDSSPDARIEVSIQGGDAYFVLEVEPGTEVLVPGYDDDEDFSDWQELEIYLQVLADGTVQLNRNSEAYYANASRYGASAPGEVGPDVPPDWETVATDGTVAWHDHRIHWMSPLPPRQVDTGADEPQRVNDYLVPIVIDGELVVVEGTLDYVADGSPLPVLLLAVLGLAAGVVLGRRDVRLAAVLALLSGGTVTALLVAAGTGRPAGFALATPPLALAAVGALAPLLGATVSSISEGQRKALVLLGAGALVVFGVLSTGLLDQLVGGQDGGFGNWWLRPTLPADVAPGLLRLSLGLATGTGLGILATQLITPLDEGDDPLIGGTTDLGTA